METKLIGSLIEISAGGGGNFVTQNFPTNFHTFHTRKVLTPSESTNNYRVVTAAERATLEAEDAKWSEPDSAIILSAEQNGAAYNKNTGFFELNGLTDLTAEQMVRILCDGVLSVPYPRGFPSKGIRTNILSASIGNVGCAFDRLSDISQLFRGCKDLEVIRMGVDKTVYPIRAKSIYLFAVGCVKLRKILGLISISEIKDGSANRDAFAQCPLLEEVRLRDIKVSYSFKDCPLLSLESFRYIIDNAANTKAITLTVHPDVFAKLTGDTTNAAAAALTPEELAQWQQVVTDAAEKNISFIEATA